MYHQPTNLASSPSPYPQHIRIMNHKKKDRARRETPGFGQKIFLDKAVLDSQAPHSKPVPPKIQKRRQEKREWAPMDASQHAQNTINPIRKICDSLSVPPNPNKVPIRLNLGDPTLTGNLPPSEATVAAIHAAVDEHRHDGYGPAVGELAAREAVARHFSTQQASFTADDVVLASGCSHALEMAIVAIADPGDNILVPVPGFPLYSTLCKPNGIHTRQYRLRMNDGNGLIDLQHLEELIDENTRAIIINNPSNPTGVVFPKEHLEAILRVAHKHKVPIIADEIYGDLVYDGAEFHPMATLSPKVPIITCDGIAKRYLVPGWRLGWLIVHNRYGVLTEVKKGIVALSQKIVGPNSLVQGALPRILADTPQSYFDNIKEVISKNATIVYDILSRVPGLKPLKPQGAMYMMVGFDRDIYGEETKFMQGLITEESVYCLPGSAFNLPNWFRLVLTYPEEVTREACERVVEYCERRIGPCKHLAAIYQRQESRAIDEGSEGSLSNAESDD
ncbi:aminotransferase class I and II domain-containing protein [Ditylenchus destructor]|nr:aminotransferase class I and II domain-containing protein [Ditylenchus destructor]